jgi:argininosuccinate lyase
MPFRSAYKIVGSIVAECIKNNITLDEMPLSEYKKYTEVFCEDLYEEISLETCVRKRISAGSTGYESVNAQIEYVSEFLKKN